VQESNSCSTCDTCLQVRNALPVLVPQNLDTIMAAGTTLTCAVYACAVLALSLHMAAYAALLNTCSCTSGEAAKLTHACHSSCSLQHTRRTGGQQHRMRPGHAAVYSPPQTRPHHPHIWITAGWLLLVPCTLQGMYANCFIFSTTSLQRAPLPHLCVLARLALLEHPKLCPCNKACMLIASCTPPPPPAPPLPPGHPDSRRNGA
jgi:hypothetical protein